MLEGKKVGFGITSSFCSVMSVFDSLQELKNLGADIYPIVSDNVYNLSSRFHDRDNFIQKVEEITGKEVVHTIAKAETFGPDLPLDLMIIAPITGNSLAKLANGISDNAVLMAAKTVLRNRNPLILAPFTNDALGMNGVNIMKLINVKNIYFVPFGQDNPIKKPTSMTADLSLLNETISCALEGKQRQPVIIGYKQ